MPTVVLPASAATAKPVFPMPGLQEKPESWLVVDLVANVVIAGVLTGLVYGLMALGLSVIFGVVRVVNFAHGEMMTIAMYAATVAVRRARARSVPRHAAGGRARSSSSATRMQAGLINPFITRPEHSQFMLLVAVAIIMVNALLMIFGPDARNVQLDYQLESFEIGKILVDKARLFAARRRGGRRPRRCSLSSASR